jgi:hypothetical protein
MGFMRIEGRMNLGVPYIEAIRNRLHARSSNRQAVAGLEALARSSKKGTSTQVRNGRPCTGRSEAIVMQYSFSQYGGCMRRESEQLWDDQGERFGGAVNQ